MQVSGPPFELRANFCAFCPLDLVAIIQVLSFRSNLVPCFDSMAPQNRLDRNEDRLLKTDICCLLATFFGKKKALRGFARGGRIGLFEIVTKMRGAAEAQLGDDFFIAVALSDEADSQSASETAQPGFGRQVECASEKPLHLAQGYVADSSHFTRLKARLHSHPFPIVRAEKSSVHKR